jgi:hypothetical protein
MAHGEILKVNCIQPGLAGKCQLQRIPWRKGVGSVGESGDRGVYRFSGFFHMRANKMDSER